MNAFRRRSRLKMRTQEVDRYLFVPVIENRTGKNSFLKGSLFTANIQAGGFQSRLQKPLVFCGILCFVSGSHRITEFYMDIILRPGAVLGEQVPDGNLRRSEEHTSEL